MSDGRMLAAALAYAERGWSPDLADPDVADRFWSHVVVGGPLCCWPWTGPHLATGYGTFRVGDRKTTAGRYLLERLWGRPLHRQEFVCHRCDNPPCVNPDHLFIGSQRDNMTDCAAKQRTATRGRSKRRGVSWDAARRQWQAHTYEGGRGAWLGRFDTEGEAVDAIERRRAVRA